MSNEQIFDTIKAIVYEEDLCVYEEGHNYDCQSCELCRAVFFENLKKEIGSLD